MRMEQSDWKAYQDVRKQNFEVKTEAQKRQRTRRIKRRNFVQPWVPIRNFREARPVNLQELVLIWCACQIFSSNTHAKLRKKRGTQYCFTILA